MVKRSSTYTKDISKMSQENSDKENKPRTRKHSNANDIPNCDKGFCRDGFGQRSKRPITIKRRPSDNRKPVLRKRTGLELKTSKLAGKDKPRPTCAFLDRVFCFLHDQLFPVVCS